MVLVLRIRNIRCSFKNNDFWESAEKQNFSISCFPSVVSWLVWNSTFCYASFLKLFFLKYYWFYCGYIVLIWKPSIWGNYVERKYTISYLPRGISWLSLNFDKLLLNVFLRSFVWSRVMWSSSKVCSIGNAWRSRDVPFHTFEVKFFNCFCFEKLRFSSKLFLSKTSGWIPGVLCSFNSPQYAKSEKKQTCLFYTFMIVASIIWTCIPEIRRI